ncbi:DUF1249 domain-containing protein [Aliiglaciecola sp. 3_MG-2023]|uniref:DUF1249 domain-containing protein n=1 Tax=Aliiglaciecola sp. 3_MG-2023 TaxID=3062644 RepID=UPI0026E2E5BE|nr:DUF1249 domain-containing protein [Aliiglaciecola sp. 3_MG-2023]MDO6692224.1 DUF1249 domain-containing protein [Aliiglaciecola sp. 3_MG-2023]
MTTLSRQRKYVPNLPSLLAVCEANYARLLRLLPDCDTVTLSYTFEINDGLYYRVKIIDSSRYTSTLELAQLADGVPAFLRPVMQIRLYHDANVAEVLSAQHIGSLKPSYAYPNTNMHQPNEKEMTNRFLAEWLSFCLRHAESIGSSET